MALTYRGHKISEIKEVLKQGEIIELFRIYIKDFKEVLSPEDFLNTRSLLTSNLDLSSFCYAVEMYEEGINLIPSAFEQAIKEVAESCKPDEQLKASFDNSIRKYYDPMPSFRTWKSPERSQNITSSYFGTMNHFHFDSVPSSLNDVPDIDLMKDIISDQSYKVDAEIERIVRRVIRVFLGTEILDLESLKGQFELITSFDGSVTNLIHLASGSVLLSWIKDFDTFSYSVIFNVRIEYNTEIFSNDKFGNLILKTEENE